MMDPLELGPGRVSRRISEVQLELNTEAGAVDIPTSVTTDYRILWIRERVMKFLGLGNNYFFLFDNLINENDRYFEDKMLNFLILDSYGVMDLERKLVLFYKTYRNEVVQEEVAIWEESNKLKMLSHAAFSKGKSQRLTKSAPGKVEKIDDEAKSDNKPKKTKKDDSSEMSMGAIFTTVSTMQESEEDAEEDESRGIGTDSSTSLLKKKLKLKSTSSFRPGQFVPPPGEEDKYILTKKVVDKVVQIPVLHIFFGEIDPNNTEIQHANLFYFMRTRDQGIPAFESQKACDEEITQYIAVGSLNGRLLPTFNRLLVHAFKPLVEKQYRGVAAAERQIDEMRSSSKSDTAMGKTSATVTSRVESQATAFTRPSNYRRLSAAVSKMEDSKYLSTKDSKVDGIRSLTSFSESGKDRKIPTSKFGETVESTSSKYEKESELRKEEPLESSKKELLEHLDKLTTSVQWTLEHIEADVLLTVPKVSELKALGGISSVSLTEKDEIEQLEEIVMSWGKHIQKVLETYTAKNPEGKGPLAEYEYWRDRETGLSILVEQLKTPNVREILNMLDNAESPIASAFNSFETDLRKYHSEARDNNKFLFTVLRYFKLIAESDSFEAIEKALPALCDGIKMIWVLSKYYCTEEKMVPLLERISWDLCQNVMKNLAINELFKKPLDEVLKKAADARAMMKNWKVSYLKTREGIELSGKGQRWEFDQNRLFKETEYIGNLCNDLNKVASVLQDFYNIFGAELKSIIHDPAQIDTIIKKVDELVTPLENADFNIFAEFNKENWDATMSCFYMEVASLENEGKSFIDACFNVLISAEQALEVLMKFKGIKTRQAIQERLLTKFDVIMQQFSKEISMVEDIFNRGKRNPPLLRYHPPIAGAIFWERQLFQRLKNPVLIFQDIKELKHSELKLLAFQQYYDIAKLMKNYEETKFSSWKDKARLTVLNTMQKSVLKTIPFERESAPAMNTTGLKAQKKKPRIKSHGITETPERLSAMINASGQQNEITATKQSIDAFGSAGKHSGKKVVLPSLRRKSDTKLDASADKDCKASEVSSLTDKHQQKRNTKIITWQTIIRDGTMVEHQLRFEINFNSDVFEIIQEAELLEKMGFELPEAVRDVAIQRERLQADIEVTKTMIDKYNEIVSKLTDPDIRLLKKNLHNIEKHILPGVTRLNWYSLGISDYAASCEKLLKGLSSTVTQVKQLTKDLDQSIENEIRCYNLFTTTEIHDSHAKLKPCKTYFIDIETKRTELVCAMLKTYQSASPKLIKLESLVEGTATGKSPGMQLFYETYEHNIFTALIYCALRNLEELNSRLLGSKAIFQVYATLVSSEIILRPGPNEIHTIILHDVKDLIERFKVFPRWLSTTCHECKPIKQPDSEEFVTHSFFDDVMRLQIVNDRIISVQETTQKLTLDCWKYLHRWKKYDNLWRFDKNEVCEKFATEDPTLLRYDEEFTVYGAIVDEIEEMSPYVDITSIRINLEPLQKAIKDHAKEWKQVLGNYLIERTQLSMNDLKSKMDTFRRNVELVITGLDRFKVVMQTISDIKTLSVQAEVQYQEYQETFRTLHIHRIEYSEEDEKLAHKLEKDWESLYFGALHRTMTLETTKDRFSDMTTENIANFAKEIIEFSRDFETNGPGSVGDDLDRGIKKMEEYRKLIAKMEEKRLDLVNDENLFDLPPANYSAFLKLKSDFEGMEILYKLYKRQKNARDGWSKTRWVDLDPQHLIDGMDQFVKEFRKMPKSVRQLNVGQSLEANMKTFKNSVPLFVELKNKAMRERHWELLMDKTGIQFNVAPDRCDHDQ